MVSAADVILPLIIGPVITLFIAFAVIGIAQMFGLTPTHTTSTTTGDDLFDWFGGDGDGGDGDGGGD